MSLPDTLFRVEFMEGYGMPDCERKERTSRTYTSARDAARMVVEIKRLPDHHELLGVYKCHPRWDEATQSIETLADLMIANAATEQEAAS